MILQNSQMDGEMALQLQALHSCSKDHWVGTVIWVGAACNSNLRLTHLLF